MTRAVSIAQGGSNNVTMRNRIINGAMVIDQRNAGSMVNVTSGETYSVDRFFARFTAGSYSVTQGQSTTAPTGFKNSFLVNVTTGGTVTASTRGLLCQRIEGYNWADLGYGAAGAASSTLSFWVRSSLTGTFSGALQNIAGDRSYAFTYTINSANTWEYKTISVSGDTSGTWLTTNGGAIQLDWDLGNGSDLKTATTGSWLAGDYRGVTGSVAPMATSGATFYITGVQLEAGTTATPFEQRLYGTELALCQRYCQIITRSSGSLGVGSVATKQSGSYLLTTMTYQTMRTSPTWANAPSSWDITGSPSATQAYAYEFATGFFVSINSGSLSIINQLSASQGRFYLQSSTTFSGSTGGVFAIGLGADMILTAEL